MTCNRVIKDGEHVRRTISGGYTHDTCYLRRPRKVEE
jgi:hypothetical protein